MEKSAEFSAKIWNGDCPPASSPTCSAKAISPTAVKRQNQVSSCLAEVSENAYFASLAAKRAEQLNCIHTQTTELLKNSENLQKFTDGFAAKVISLVNEKKKIIQFRKKSSLTASELQDYELSKSKAEAITDSIPFTESEAINKIVINIVSQNENYDPEHQEQWLPKQIKNLVSKALTDSKKDLESNIAVLNQGIQTSGTSFDTHARESLAQDEYLIDSYRLEQLSNQESIKPIACAVDQKYGHGAQYRDRALMGVSFIPIIGYAARFTKASKLAGGALSMAIKGTTAVKAISARSAGVLAVLAGAGASASSIIQINHSCSKQTVNLATKKTESKTFFTCEGNILLEQEVTDCMLAKVFGVLDLAALTLATKQVLTVVKNGHKETLAASILAEEKLEQLAAQQTKTILEGNPQIEIWRLSETGDGSRSRSLVREVEEALKESPMMPGSEVIELNTTSRPKIIKLANGITGVWKKMDGKLTSGNAEIATYKIDKKLGFNHVPITVERTQDGVKGSMQLFVSETDRATLPRDQKYFYWFDDLIGNKDRHELNYFTVKGRPIAIDHGASFENISSIEAKSTDFTKYIEQSLKPLEEQKIVVQKITNRLQEAALRFGMNSGEYNALKTKLAPQLTLEAAKEREIAKATQNNLSNIFPEKKVFESLRDTSDSEWRAILSQNLSKNQISNFLGRRDKIVSTMETVSKFFGDGIFRDGQIKPILKDLKEIDKDAINELGIKSNHKVLDLKENEKLGDILSNGY
jgi:hypothetical protein